MSRCLKNDEKAEEAGASSAASQSDGSCAQPFAPLARFKDAQIGKGATCEDKMHEPGGVQS